jgi:hypothetical protein
MTDIEGRLAAAFADRERGTEVDENAWQTHVALVQGMSRTTVIRRWRSPVLVAAAVVSLGLLGGIVTQTGISGMGTVRPAGPDSGSVAAPRSTSSPAGTPMSSGPIPTGAGARIGVPQSTRAPAPGHRPTSSGDRSTSSRSVPSTTSAPDRPDSSPQTTAEASSAAIPVDGAVAGDPPTMTSSPTGVLLPVAQRTSAVTSRPTSALTLSGPPNSSADPAPVGVDGKVPCGAVLPPLEQQVSGLILAEGPYGDVVNEAHQPLPVLAVGFALLSDDGRIASVTGSDPRITEVAARRLPSGRSAKADLLPLTPTGVCPSIIPAAIWHLGQNDPPVYPVSPVPQLQAGIYRATSVVLLGEDLAHAHAYRAGSIWQLSSG